MDNLRLTPRREIKNIRELIDGSCRLYKSKPAFMVPSKEGYVPIEYGKLYTDYRKFAFSMKECGLLGKKVAVLGNNSYWWSIVYISVVCTGGTILPLDKELPTEETLNLIERGKPSAIFCGEKVYDEISGLLKEKGESIQCCCLESDVADFIEKAADNMITDEQLCDISDDDVASIVFTSGTMGEAKGVMLSHKNISSNIYQMTRYSDVCEKDVFLSVLPAHHTYEATCGFLCALYLGATIAYATGIRHIMKNLVDSKATIMLGVPLIFENIYRRMIRKIKKSGKYAKFRFAICISKICRAFGKSVERELFADILKEFGELKLMISGAAPIDSGVIKGYRNLGIKMLQGYGLTECSPIVALMHTDCVNDLAVGVPLKGTEIKIDSQNGEKEGEILVKGSSVMLGYYENESATLEAISDGWLHTGDVGYFDSKGYLYISGRKKNVIINKNGKNVYPEEIEGILEKNPYISETLVSGIFDTKDEDVRISAQIIPDMAACEEKLGDKTSDENIEKLINDEVKKINMSLQSYKKIMIVKIRKEPFKKTTTNKIKRYIEK